MGDESKGIVIKIEDSIVTIEVDGYPYDFPQQMIPNNVSVNDVIAITKESIEIIE